MFFSGIGLALAGRLLDSDSSIRLCLACRNKGRAEAAQSSLLTQHPDSDVSILLVDVSTIQSVYKAAEEIKKRYSMSVTNRGHFVTSLANRYHFVTSLSTSVTLLLYILDQ